MNEDANDIYKSLVAETNRNLINECAELREKLQAAEARAAIYAEAVDKLTESAEKWALDAARESERADAAEDRLRASCDDEHERFIEATEWKLRAEAAEDRVKELEAYVQHLTARLKELEALAEKWAVDARNASECADNLWEQVDRAKACILALNRAIDAARQQGGAK